MPTRGREKGEGKLFKPAGTGPKEELWAAGLGLVALAFTLPGLWMLVATRSVNTSVALASVTTPTTVLAAVMPVIVPIAVIAIVVIASDRKEGDKLWSTPRIMGIGVAFVLAVAYLFTGGVVLMVLAGLLLVLGFAAIGLAAITAATSIPAKRGKIVSLGAGLMAAGLLLGVGHLAPYTLVKISWEDGTSTIAYLVRQDDSGTWYLEAPEEHRRVLSEPPVNDGTWSALVSAYAPGAGLEARWHVGQPVELHVCQGGTAHRPYCPEP